ncbi:Arv1-like family-domain-containing protein, partial [Dipodascopsis tothii]|uniref:Arv1-like family-domain-containing protein n=1 Tax=Dipodascopsis tothii TaxID=44089 RepID=UPI0034CD7655
MICIECGSAVESLYQQYSSSNIRLTACPQCGKFADKYIEHDGVLIFIDLILVKTQVYRHLAFNRLATHEDGSKDGSKAPDADASGFTTTALHPLVKRMFVLTTLFDVYLTWARLEKDYHTPIVATLSGTAAAASVAGQPHTPATDFPAEVILAWPALGQYLFFLVYCLTQTLTTHAVLRFLAARWPFRAQRPRGVPVSANILSTALLISAATKLFPIIMVVWSYDIPAATKAVGWAVNVNTIEALNIVLGCGYARATLMTVLAAMARTLVARGLLLRAALIGTGVPPPVIFEQESASLSWLIASARAYWQ